MIQTYKNKQFHALVYMMGDSIDML